MILDLRKDFDCLFHSLLLSEISTTDVSQDACKLIQSDICEPIQRIMVGSWWDHQQVNKFWIRSLAIAK